MLKKIVISRFNNTAAILYDGKIQEIVTVGHEYQINDIYLGSIHKIFTSINAAFVNLGDSKKSGFIHISDLKYLRRNRKPARISDILSVNQLVTVQIIKEPTLSKGPRLTAGINLFGKYLVLMPLSNSVNVSSKIYDRSERSYLYALAVLLKPATMGLLVRSSASGVNAEVLLEDLRLLKQQWYFIQKLAISNSFPLLLYREEDLVKKIVRDLHCPNTRTIVSDSLQSLYRVRYYLNRWSCNSFNANLKLQLLTGSESILDKFHVKSGIINALRPKVSLSVGGYLFIESYESFTLIDVNSGSFNQSNNSAENVLRSNCYAATEIAYQLRVRNINGVVVVDFIDMESHKDQLQLLEHFACALNLDRARPQIIQLSKLGLVELTRRRREQSLFELFHKIREDYVYLDNFLPFDLRKPINNYDLVNKNINTLFFNTFCYTSIYIAFHLVYWNNHLKIVELRAINASYLPHFSVAPLMLYSRVVSSSMCLL